MKKYLTFIFLSLLPLSVFAQELNTRPYFIASLGASVTQESSLLADNIATAIAPGFGWDFSDHLGAEFGYIDLGTVDYKTGTIEGSSKAVFASLNPYYQFDSLRLFGKAGIDYWSSEIKDLTLKTSNKERGISPLAGIGVEYQLGRAITSWSLRLELTRHFQIGDDKVTPASDIDAVLIGFVFRH